MEEQAAVQIDRTWSRVKREGYKNVEECLYPEWAGEEVLPGQGGGGSVQRGEAGPCVGSS